MMKNEYEIRGDITAIIINSPKYGRLETLISTNKLQKVNEFEGKWFVTLKKGTQSFYVQGHMPIVNGKHSLVKLHRWVTDAPTGFVVDHMQYNTLDNTDSNLRVITNGENLQNRKGPDRDNKSGVRGVCWNKRTKKWIARVKQILIGSFDSIHEAEKAVVEARRKHMPYSQSDRIA